MQRRLPVLTVGLLAATMCAIPCHAAKVTLNVVMWDAFAGQEKATMEAFQKAYPNIKLKMNIVPGGAVDDKFMAMKAANVPLDVFFNYAVYGWASYANNGLFTDLSPYIKRDAASMPKDIMPIAFSALKYDGKPVGVLHNAMAASGVWYNERLVQEAGLPLLPTSWDDATWTWDKFVEYARKLTKQDSAGKFSQMGVDFWTADNIIQFCWSFGGDWFPRNAYDLGYADKTTINSPQNIKAFEALRDLRFRYMVYPSSKTKGYSGEGWTSLYKGKLGMFIDPIQTGAVPPASLKVRDKLAFAPMPMVPSVGRVDGFAWLEGMAMCKGTKHPNEAWTFMKWMMTDATKHGNMRFPGNGVRRSSWAATLDQASSYFDVERSKPVVEGALDHIRAFPRCSIMGAKQVYDAVTARITPSLSMENAPGIPQQLALAAKDADSVMSRMAIRAKRKK